MRKSERRQNKLEWQRGYFRHTLWDGETRLGQITLLPKDSPDGRYQFKVGTIEGVAESLPVAKRRVVEMAGLDRIQMRLF